MHKGFEIVALDSFDRTRIVTTDSQEADRGRAYGDLSYGHG